MASTLRLLAVATLAVLLGGLVASPAMSAPPNWQLFDESFADSSAGILGSGLSPGGHGAIAYRGKDDTVGVAEREAGQMTFTRWVTLTASASSADVVVTRDSVTYFAWTDADGLHVRRHAGSDAFGAPQKLSGSSAPLQMTALNDGSVLIAQKTATGVAVWRHAEGLTDFEALPEIDASGETTDFVLRAGEPGGAILATVGRTAVPRSTPPGTTTLVTYTVRAARMLAASATFGPAEELLTRARDTGYAAPSGAGLQVSLLDAALAGDGASQVALEVVETQGTNESDADHRTAERGAGGVWSSWSTRTQHNSVNLFGGLRDFRLVPIGDRIVATWAEEPSGPRGDRQPFEARAMPSVPGRQLDESTLLTRAETSWSEGYVELRSGLTLAPDRALALVERSDHLNDPEDDTLTGFVLDADAEIVERLPMVPGGPTRTSDAATDGAGSVLVPGYASRDIDPAIGRAPVALLDPFAPTLDQLAVPARATAGASVRLAGTVIDNERATIRWDLGDGRTVTGNPVDVSWPDAGTRTVKGTAVDGSGNVSATLERTITVDPAPALPTPPAPPQGGNPPSGGNGPTPDAQRPVVSALRLTRTRFAARSRVGTTLSFRVDEPGRLRLAVERAAKGYKRGGRCVATRPSGQRKAARCTLVVGTSTRAVRAGTNRLRITGRTGGKALKPGRYRLRLVVTDDAGNRSSAKAVSFTVVR